MFEKYEFGWRVDMKLTKPQADSVVKAIKNIVDSWAKANTDAYYKSVVKVDMDVGKGGNVSFLNVLGDVGDNRTPRQIIFYRDEGNGTFYLEGDFYADITNQYAFNAGFEKLRKIWKLKNSQIPLNPTCQPN